MSSMGLETAKAVLKADQMVKDYILSVEAKLAEARRSADTAARNSVEKSSRHRAELAALRAEIERKDAALRTAREVIEKARKSLPDDSKHGCNAPWSQCIAILEDLRDEIAAALSSGDGEGASGCATDNAGNVGKAPAPSPTLSREAAERIERKLRFGTFSTQEDVIQAILAAAQEESQ